MKVTVDKDSWEAGYRAGLEGWDRKPPPEMDGHAYWAGYIEGKAERLTTASSGTPKSVASADAGR
jgi:hypothetical protein